MRVWQTCKHIRSMALASFSNHMFARPAGSATTAAQATAQQPGVAGTAEHAKGVAEHAASVAHERGPGATGDYKDTIPALQAKTGQAVEQGKADAQGYVQQAINLANSAVNSASVCFLFSVRLEQFADWLSSNTFLAAHKTRRLLAVPPRAT